MLDKAKKHELISDHEHRDLAYIRDLRNRYGHPSGASPSRTQVLAALDTAVQTVLSCLEFDGSQEATTGERMRVLSESGRGLVVQPGLEGIVAGSRAVEVLAWSMSRSGGAELAGFLMHRKNA